MGTDKEFKFVENVRDEGNDKFPKRKVDHESKLEFQIALDYLQQILDTARAGNFLVETDGKSVNLTPTGAVDLEIKAKDKGGRQSLSFELAWENIPERPARRAEAAEENVQGDVCVAHRARSMEDEAGDYDELERRFEQELFGGCGCVAVPGS